MCQKQEQNYLIFVIRHNPKTLGIFKKVTFWELFDVLTF